MVRRHNVVDEMATLQEPVLNARVPQVSILAKPATGCDA